VNDRDDPPRLFDPAAGGPPALGELFRSARADLPSPAELAGLSARLETAVARRAVPTSAPRLTPKVALGLGAGLVGLALGVGLLSSKPAAEPSPTRAPSAASAAITTSPLAAGVSRDRGSARTPPPTIEPSAAVLPSAPEPAPAASASSASRGPRGPSEAALLEAARAALGSNPARALALTREHARRYPRGILAQEREVIAIEALRRSGQSRAAHERASEFQREFPGSPHRRTVDTQAP